MPAKAGIHAEWESEESEWTPAFAGVTERWLGPQPSLGRRLRRRWEPETTRRLNSLRLLPSGPDRVGESAVRPTPAAHMVEVGRGRKTDFSRHPGASRDPGTRSLGGSPRGPGFRRDDGLR